MSMTSETIIIDALVERVRVLRSENDRLIEVASTGSANRKLEARQMEIDMLKEENDRYVNAALAQIQRLTQVRGEYIDFCEAISRNVSLPEDLRAEARLRIEQFRTLPYVKGKPSACDTESIDPRLRPFQGWEPKEEEA